MIKVFNTSLRTFRLETPDGRKMIIPCKSPADVPEEFTGDITYRMALKAHDIQVYQIASDVDKLIREQEAKLEELKGIKEKELGEEIPEATEEAVVEKPKTRGRKKATAVEAE